jgi:hypothetical protein
LKFGLEEFCNLSMKRIKYFLDRMDKQRAYEEEERAKYTPKKGRK